MDLQNRSSSSQDDQWANEAVLNHNQIKPYSLFNKIVIKYDDKTIQNFIDKECQKPILNSNLFPFQDQNEQYQQQQTQQEQTRSNSFKFNQRNNEQKMNQNKNQNKQMINQNLFKQQNANIQEEQTTNRIPCQDQINENQSKKKSKGNKIQTNQQALFDPIQDDQNQNWIRKKQDINNFDAFKQSNQRPLTCPQCFTQVCYSYKQINTKKQQKNNNGTLSMFSNGQKMFASKKLENIIVNEHKIIRNKFSQENMKQNFFISNLNLNGQTYSFVSRSSNQNDIKLPQIKNNKMMKNRQKQLKSYEQNLKARLQDINIKILVSCQQCELQLGFWDVNQQVYVLLNVI